MSANGISHLSTKQARQKAKLDLAATKRAADLANRDNPTNADLRSTYDITELPTQYSGNSIVDNPNSSGLILGRPWIAGVLSPINGIQAETGDLLTTESGLILIPE
jgi:hypothetical protein